MRLSRCGKEETYTEKSDHKTARFDPCFETARRFNWGRWSFNFLGIHEYEVIAAQACLSIATFLGTRLG